MRAWLKWLAFFILLGFCFGAAALRAQIVNPTYAVLNLNHYRAYYGFYHLGEQLDRFAELGVLAATLVLAYFLLTAVRAGSVTKYLILSNQGEQFSWPWRATMVCLTLVLGLLGQAGLLLVMGAHLYTRSFGVLHGLLLLALPGVPLLFLLLLGKTVPEHKVLRAPLGILSASGLLLALNGSGLALQIADKQFLIPPLVSTYFGPWGILGWTVSFFTCLGVVVASLLVALTPRIEAEPDSLTPLDRGALKLAAVMCCGVAVSLTLIFSAYLVPRFQIGQDLSRVLSLKEGPIEGRTVVWLDSHDPPHTIEPFVGTATPENMLQAGEWMKESQEPNALIRPAAKALGDYALWNWEPERALFWLEIHRLKQRFSNLNWALLRVIDSSKPDPKLSWYLDHLTDPELFAWPGAGSRLTLARELERYGRDEEAESWRKSAQDLGAENLPQPAPVPGSGVIRGQILLDGKPLSGAPVGLFRGTVEQEVLNRTRQHIEGEKELVRPRWRPAHYQYLDLKRLRDFYAVEVTDQNGYFRFDDAEPGVYRLGVRLRTPAAFLGNNGLTTLEEGEEIDLGTLRLTLR